MQQQQEAMQDDQQTQTQTQTHPTPERDQLDQLDQLTHHRPDPPATVSPSIPPSDRIKLNDVVVFDINHGFKTHILKVTASTTFQFGRTEVPTASLVGHPYGTLFEVQEVDQEDRLVAVPFVRGVNEWKQDDHAFERVEGHTSGRGIQWSPGNQRLGDEDIRKMKEGGMGGAELVETISKNSSTFDDKTILAQKKFRKRKERKHVLVGCARRPTAKTISEAYYGTPKLLKKIGNLRPDALAMALCLANVCAGQRVLVIEQSGGLVAGAVMERLGGHGECCVGRVGKNRGVLSVLDGFGFDERVGGVLTYGNLGEMLGEVGGLGDRTKAFTYKGKRFDASNGQDGGAEVEAEGGEGGGEGLDVEVEVEVERGAKRAKGGGEDEGTVATTATTATTATAPTTAPAVGRFTSLIITATNFSQKSLLLASLPLLAPSASLAVVSPTLQPLVDLMNLIKVRGFVIAPVINEPWKRDIQVLPKRTHPDMNMDHCGGYILSGTVSKRGRWIDLRRFAVEQQSDTDGGPAHADLTSS